MTPEEEALWEHAESLWSLSQRRNPDEVRAGLHPDYCGWDLSMPEPHDREFAVTSVTDGSSKVAQYELKPHSVRIYDGVAGVVHYSYKAVVEPKGLRPINVTGKWTEIYLMQQGNWVMIGVSGRPDPRPEKPSNVGRDVYA